MNAGNTDMHVAELIALGYRRTSCKHGMVTRIDKRDWIKILAESMSSVEARYFDPRTGRPSGDWCDHYRRVHSRDTLTFDRRDPDQLAKFQQIPRSGFDDCGYIEPATMREILPPKLPRDVLDVLSKLKTDSDDSWFIEQANKLLEKYA